MNETLILKTDQLGRVRTPRSRQDEIVDEWLKSGSSAMSFARAIGVNYQTLNSWIKRRQRESDQAQVGTTNVEPVKPLWFEMTAPDASVPNTPLRIELPGGARMLLGDTTHVALAVQLLKALA